MNKYLMRLKAREDRERLYKVISDLSRMENWDSRQSDAILSVISRQPLYAVAADLAYFRARLEAAIE